MGRSPSLGDHMRATAIPIGTLLSLALAACQVPFAADSTPSTFPTAPALATPSVETPPPASPTASLADVGFGISLLTQWSPAGFLTAEWAPDSGRLLYSATDVFGDGDSTSLVDVRSGTDQWRRSDSAAEFAFSPDGTVLAAADGQLRFLDAASGEVLSFGYETNGETRMAYLPDGTLIVGMTWLFSEDAASTEIGIWNVATRDLDKVTRIDGYLGGVAVDRGGNRLLLSLSQLPGAEPQKVALWDPTAMVELCSVAGENGAFTPSGQTFVATHLDLLTVFEANRCDTTRILSSDGSIGSVAFAPDGHTVVLAGSPSGHLWFYDTVTGALLDDVTLQDDRPIDALAFSPDGKYLLVLAPAMVSVWEVGSRN